MKPRAFPNPITVENHSDRSTGALVSALGRLLAVAGIAFGALSCGPVVEERRSLVLITIDTLRADHLGAYGYFRDTSPHIDRFAADALLFERAVAPMATTLPSHVSIMTSTYPVRHGILSNFRFFKQPLVTGDHLQTAAQLLRAEAYATAAFTSSSPLSAETGIGAGFDTFHGPPAYEAHDRRVEWRAEETVDHAIAWLEGATSPFFLWVHLFDPHHPYAPPAPHDQAFSTDAALFEFLKRYHFPPRHHARSARETNLYDGEIRYTDEQVGRFLGKLESMGLYENAVIVLTADHGEGLMQHSLPRHGVIWNEQLLVPLIFRFPAGPTGRRDSLASLIDILPTLAGHGGLPLRAEQLDGIDLLVEERSSALSQKRVRADSAQFTLMEPAWKYWYLPNGGDRLYDHLSDPHEMTNLIGSAPGVGERMRQEIVRLIETNRSRSTLPVREEEIPEPLRRRLEELGYTE
jgi:arylsulfatase A-like enzyme